MGTMAEAFGDSSPFAPKGDESEATVIEHLLLDCPEGGLLTYADFSQAIGREFRDSRTPFFVALRRVERNAERTFANVRGVGYRRVAAKEHLGEGQRHEKKARRQVGKAASKYGSADRSALTVEERKELDAASTGVKRLQQAMRSTDRRIKVIEEKVSDEALDAKIAAAVVRVLTERDGTS